MSTLTSPTGKKILVVEDDRALMSMLANMLRLRGGNVIEATDGAIGIAMTENEHPDLLVVDIETPKLSGIAMLRELRKRGVTTPAMILSNSSHPQNVALATDLGITEYLVKADWEIDEVVEKIFRHLSN